MRFHTNLPVDDLDATVAFYRVLFDSEPVKLKADYAKFDPDDLALNISFRPDPQGAGALRGLHLGLQVEDPEQLDRLHARLAAAGLISVERDTGICCYARQDKFWVRDPSGYEWELYVLIQDTAQRMDQEVHCCEADPQATSPSTGCC